MFWRRGKSKATRSGDEQALLVAANEQVYAVGDIHGRSDLLEALLAKIEADAASRSSDRILRLIFLGDYIDRGDDSKQVIDLLMNFENPNFKQVDYLAGNHEAALLEFLSNPFKGRNWLDWGGRQTLASYGIRPPKASVSVESEELSRLRDSLVLAMGHHVKFFQNLERIVTSGSVAFAHAALDPAYALEEQPEAALLWGKTKDNAESGLPGYRLVHGHFASSAPVSLPHRICADTGAYYSGILTAVRLDDGEVFVKATVDDI